MDLYRSFTIRERSFKITIWNKKVNRAVPLVSWFCNLHWIPFRLQPIQLINHYFSSQLSDVQLVAVSHWGVHLVKRESNQLQVIRSFALTELGSCSAPRPTSVMFDGVQGRVTLHTPRAQQLSEMVNKFCSENRKVSVFSNWWCLEALLDVIISHKHGALCEWCLVVLQIKPTFTCFI